MTRSRFLILLLLLINIHHLVSGQVPQWIWAKNGVSLDDDWLRNIAVDPAGNVYAAGRFAGDSISFDSITLMNVNQFWSLFIVKYNPQGEAVWAKTAIGIYSDCVTDICTTPDGYLYAVGYTSSPSLTFDTLTLSSQDGRPAFIIKYDNSGTIQWGKMIICNIGSSNQPGELSRMRICTDAAGNIYITGIFSSTTLTVDSLLLNNTDMVNTGFIIKMDALGNVCWGHVINGVGEVFGLDYDHHGNLVMTGYFTMPYMEFQGDTLVNTSPDMEIFLVKCDTSGNLVWAQSAAGIGPEGAEDVTTDLSGNIYQCGTFGSDSVTFGSLVLSKPPAVDWDAFIVKYDPNGNALWGKRIYGTWMDVASAIDVDANGNAIVAGVFYSGQVNAGQFWAIGHGFLDSYICKYDSTGQVLWFKAIGGSQFDIITGIARDAWNNIYIGGNFTSDSIIIGNTTLVNSSTWGEDFIAKIGITTSVNNVDSTAKEFTLFPNPCHGHFTVVGMEPITEILITNVLGNEVYQSSPKSMEVGCYLSVPGIYMVRVATGKVSRTLKVFVL